MKTWILSLIPIIWVVFVYVCGIWLFSAGFLLTRIVIERNSTCEGFISTTDGPGISAHILSDSQPGCWFPPKFKKSILIIIDGLRYDFVLYNTSEKNDSMYYLNKMPVFHETIKKHPENSILFKFLADPPTTTMQRLKALTSGSLPTYMDISSNFASYMIDEDNLIRQMHDANKKMVFMGDDTWQGLHPNGSFERSYFYPSFNVKDLHTVDNGIIDHLIPEINTKDWDVIIAHFLGVDHCGHRYGPSHPEMANKLAQMNDIVTSVIEKISQDKDTILFVFGDHGMTRTGDHGGDTDNEISSALFVYSSEKITPEREKISSETVHQVDLIPTFSLLLGIPIPYSNIGKVITQLFGFEFDCNKIKPNSEFTCKEDIPEIKTLWTSIAALRINVAQVQRYLNAYSQVSLLLPPEIQRRFDELLERYDRQWVLLSHIPSTDKSDKIKNLKKLRTNYESFMQDLKFELVQIWARYDMRAIVTGIIIQFFGIIANVFAISFIGSKTFKLSRKIGTGLLMGITSVTLLYLVGFPLENPARDMIALIVITSVLLVFGSSFLKKLNKFHYSRGKEWLTSLFSISSFGVIIFSMHLISGFSNSFVVYEDAITHFTLSSFVLIYILSQIRMILLSNNQVKTMFKYSIIVLIVIVILIRISKQSKRCREEQELCRDSNFTKPIFSLAEKEFKSFKIQRVFLSSLCLLLTYVSFRYLIHKTNLVSKYTLTGMVLRYLLPCAMLCISGHWILNLVESAELQQILSPKQDLLAKTGAILCGLVMLTLILSPVLAGTDQPTFVTQRHNHLAISLCSLWLTIMTLLCLWLGDGVNISLLCLSLLTCLLLFVFKYWTKSTTWKEILLWYLLSSYGFFATGHQTSLASIPWHAAFIGNSGHLTNYFLPALQVISNIFSSQILFAVSLPLICLLIEMKSKDLQSLVFDVTKDELFYSVARAYLGYILLHGLKLFCISFSNALLRRHLMVWKIFAPRFMFEVLSASTSIICIFLTFLFLVKTNYALKRKTKNYSHKK